MSDPSPERPAPSRRRYVPAVGPNLRKLLFVVFGLFALLAVNSVYLLGVRAMEWVTGLTYQNWFYLLNFLLHLILGVLIIVPVILYGIFHMKNAYGRPNRRAVRAGIALFVTALVLLGSGIILTRIEGVFEVKDPAVRSVAYWAHVITPIVAAWLFVLHRLAGTRIKWKTGLRWAAVAGAFALVMLVVHAQDPRQWNVEGPEEGERYFFPSLARTATGNFIPEHILMDNYYCAQCHQDVHDSWFNSVHHFASFNNPAYLFSIQETRDVAMSIDGHVQASRFCAGCHDPVPFFAGKFDDPEFDIFDDPTAHAGITCTSCHGITNINTVRGNADYTIEEPIHYPLAFSDSELLQAISRQLVKAKPEFHKKTFLKPLHRTAEFCGACHKVHLPPEVNRYKWLRGQNHYDSFLLSGVSGHGVASFYYPEVAQPSCNDCHMPLMRSADFGSKPYADREGLWIRDHMFPSANTAIAQLVDLPDKDEVIAAHEAFNEGVMRVDIFGLREGGTIDGPLAAPLRPEVPALEPGKRYLLQNVIRTVDIGHEFTQGTADSNEVWLDITVTSGGRVIGRSGGFGPSREVDPWSHFVNVFMLDRDGYRIDRRNPQDIFVPLYNHQIPPGAADTVHYLLKVPEQAREPITVEVALRYRKFDTTFMQHVFGPEFENTLHVMTLAEDRITFPVAGGPPAPANSDSEIVLWQRWNDFGIGLLRQGALRQAEEAFARVEELGRPDGPLNLARVYIAQGAVGDRAIEALERAAAFEPSAPPWSVAWFSGIVNQQNGFFDEAVADFRGILEADDEELRRRGFDFSRDYRVWNRLGQALFERAKQERGEARRAAREALLEQAVEAFQQTLALEPENVTAHFNLQLVYRQLGEEELAERHRQLHGTYRVDDNARDRAIALARARYPAANHAAEEIVIYDLQRPGAYELGDPAVPPAERVASSRLLSYD